jgi:hypothetical protein
MDRQLASLMLALLVAGLGTVAIFSNPAPTPTIKVLPGVPGPNWQFIVQVYDYEDGLVGTLSVPFTINGTSYTAPDTVLFAEPNYTYELTLPTLLTYSGQGAELTYINVPSGTYGLTYPGDGNFTTYGIENNTATLTFTTPSFSSGVGALEYYINFPGSVQITVTSDPIFADAFSVNGVSETGPISFPWIAGVPIDLAAHIGGTTYIFNRWSDGGAWTHTVTPTANTTYTAYFLTPGDCASLPPIPLLQLEYGCIIPAIVNTYAYVIGAEWLFGIIAAVLSGMLYLKTENTWLVLVVNVILMPVCAFLLPAQFSGLIYSIFVLAIAGTVYLLIRG